MAINISILGLRVVKESSGRYDINRRITCPDDIYAVAIEVLEMEELAEEKFNMITLDTKNNITGIFTVSTGSLNASIVHPREVFKRAILQNANAIVLLHNHPSGDPKPSIEDVSITKRLVEVGTIIGINVLDHVIIGDGRFFSMKGRDLI
jgi:DNA repair protein RadC